VFFVETVAVYRGISREKLEDLIEKIRKVRVVLIGDLCIDVYWRSDMTKSELSRETPHFPLPVVEEWMSPGAGGNVAANIAALKPESVKAVGVTGKDWRGDALAGKFRELGIDASDILVSGKVVTNGYCKPLRIGISTLEYEDPRIDFANYEPLPKEEEGELVRLLRENARDADVLCVSDQFSFGCVTPLVRKEILSLARKGKKIVVDSRERIGLFKGVTLKPNEVEGLRAVKRRHAALKGTFEDYARTAAMLSEQNDSKVCMTIGPDGCLYAESGTVTHIPAGMVHPPIDICGAGDTFLSAFSCALAAGAEPCEAASFANLAAGVTIRKIGTTGTASPDEIRMRLRDLLPAGGMV
jgi:rfaE bifunctional protein kinase chain/domain